MIGIDTNIFADIFGATSPHHAAAMAFLDNRQERFCTTPINIGETLRLITHPKIFPSPVTIAAACQRLELLFTRHTIKVLPENDNWWKIIHELADHWPGLSGNDIFDARIALSLRDNGVRKIWTRDRGFRRFPFLEIVDF